MKLIVLFDPPAGILSGHRRAIAARSPHSSRFEVVVADAAIGVHHEPRLAVINVDDEAVGRGVVVYGRFRSTPGDVP